MPHAPRFDFAEILGHRVIAQQVGVVADDLDRLVELGALGEGARGAHLRDGEFAQFLGVVEQRLMQLLEAADPKRGVGRPRRGVERPPRGRDGLLRFVDPGVGSVTDDFTGGGVDRREDPARW